MKITLLRNNLQRENVVNQGIDMVKQDLASINFPVTISEKIIQKTFNTFGFSNPTIGQGFCVDPKQILAEVDGSEDIAFLIFNNNAMNPKPLNPVQSYEKKGRATPCQMCEQWYNGFPEVFRDFFLHEMCHAMYFLLGITSQDVTHFQGMNPAYSNKQNNEWYLHLIQTMMPAWKNYIGGTVPVDPSPVRTLRVGMKGNDVKQLQTDLNQIIGSKLLMDGEFGRRTFQAVIDFQTKYGLIADGVVGAKTRAKIAEKKTLVSDNPFNLRPIVLQKSNELVKEAAQANRPIRVISGYRSIEKQDALWRQGRETPGPIVTNARGGYSYHNYGVAFDIVCVGHDDYDFVGKLGKSLGLEWGGDFVSFVDKPHFEMKKSYKIQDFLDKKVDFSKWG